MKILEANAGALTNFEVLDFLRSRGAGKGAARVMIPVLPSEFKVFDYLESTAACNQTRTIVEEFLAKCRSYALSKAEILNIINVRPSSMVELFPIIEEYDMRFGENAETMEELVDTIITQVLPSPPTEMETNEQVDEGEDKGAEIAPATQMESDEQAVEDKEAALEAESVEATK